MKDLEIELEKLFKKWKQEHIEDSQYEYNTPKYKGKLIPKENFISDGFCVSEIEIINPKFIVCCGKGLKNIIKMIYENNNRTINRDIVEVYHPSYHFIKDDKYKNIFEQKLREENIEIL